MVLRAPPGARAPRSGMPAWASASSPPFRSPRHSETLGRLHLHSGDPALHPSGPHGPLQPVWGPSIRGCVVCLLYVMENGKIDDMLFLVCAAHKQEASTQP